jgi:hypothetical protein
MILSTEVQRLALQAYSPDQPRAANGRFGSGGESTTHRGTSARTSYKPVTVAKRQIAKRSEVVLAKALAMKHTENNAPFDLLGGNKAVEVKTMVDQSNSKVTMHPDSLSRKLRYARQNKVQPWTIVVDRRPVAEANYYVRKGVGSFRLSSMTPVPSVDGLRAYLQ